VKKPPIKQAAALTLKRAIILAAVAVLASCGSFPEFEGEYPPFGEFWTSQPPQIAEDKNETATDSAEQEDPLFGRPEQSQEDTPGEDRAGSEEPEISMEEPDQEPADLSDAEPELAEETPDEEIPESMETSVPPAVSEIEPPAPETPVSEPPPVQPPPPQAAAEPQVIPPDQPPQAAAQQPRRETPPPPPPVTVQPAQPAPPPRQERENPAVAIADMPFQPAAVIPEPPAEPDLSYSRTVRALVGQYIEIPFRGPGWVYLGEFGSRRGVSYDSRRMEEEGMTFVFRADAEGTYSLRFNQQDFIRDYILNDYVKVIVEQSPQRAGSSWNNPQIVPDRVYAAPRWPLPTDPAGTARTPAASGETPAGQSTTAAAQPSAGQGGTTPPTQAATAPAPTASTSPATGAATSTPPTQTATAPAPATSTPPATGTATPAVPPTASTPSATVPASTPPAAVEDWIKKAREEYNAGHIAGALSALDQFMIRYPGGSDEAYWLYGQSLEANNEATRNIRLALDYYRRLVREFPQSSRCDDARRRIAYLERFYFNIQ
jgi:TolA-binding protein